jgi:hypothetical protein
MLGDMGKHVTQVRLWIGMVQFGRADDRVHRGGALAATVGAGEEIIFTPEGNGAQRAKVQIARCLA